MKKNWVIFLSLLFTSVSSYALGSGLLTGGWEKAKSPEFVFGFMGVIGAALGQFYTPNPKKKISKNAAAILLLPLFLFVGQGCAFTKKVVSAAPSLETQYYATLDLFVSAMTEVNKAYAAEPKPVAPEVQRNYDKVQEVAADFQKFKAKAKEALKIKDELTFLFYLTQMNKKVAEIGNI